MTPLSSAESGSSRFRMARASRGAALALLLGATLMGCNGVLDVNDPDIIPTVNSPSGAIALMNGVLLRFTQATTGNESTFLMGGLLADEWRSGDTFEQRNTTDQRAVAETNSFLPGQFRTLNRVRTEGEAAIRALQQFVPTPTSNIGLMFAVSAFATNQAAESFCSGIPFSGLDAENNIVFGTARTTAEALTEAIALADQALANVGGSAGPNVANFANVIKARALLNLGQFAQAGTVAATVPTGFQQIVTHSLNTTDNQNWALNTSARRYVVADQEGGNGLPFITAADPRLPAGPSGGANAFDSQTPFRAQFIWGREDGVVVASGIEARLIEAEAALQAGDVTTFLAKLNAARQTRSDLPDLTDPGSAVARENLLFRERAFWMFGTGHRLGDLRRLIRQYGRAPEATFPTGTWHKGGNYSSDVNLPVPFDEENNPEFTGCFNRNA